MKKIGLVLFIILCVCFTSSSQEISVRESSQRIGDGVNNAFIVSIYKQSERDVSREFRRFLRDHSSRTSSRRGEIRGENTELRAISELPVNVFAKTNKKRDEVVELIVAFDLGGAYLSSTMHPGQANSAKSMLKQFAIDLSSEAYSDILREQERDLNRRDRRYSRMEREINDLENDIKRYKQRIEDNEKKLEGLRRDLRTKEEVIKERRELHKQTKREAERIR